MRIAMNGVVELVPRVVATVRPSRFVAEAHLVVLLDEVPLDEFLARAAGDPSLEGLVSTLSGCLYDDREREFVARTILPAEGGTTTTPLLVCPDDCDLTCAVVVAEVERDGERVWWTRFGVARYNPGAPAAFAAEVHWLPGVEGVTFGLVEYQTFLGRCRELERPWWT